MIYEFAPAKLNLYLHITGRRADGYHDLDSLVVFASVGDSVQLEPADRFSFKIDGPRAGALQHEGLDNNLVVKAAQSLAKLAGKELNVALTLTKKLPVASGIGGGSSDAAAVLRALASYWGISHDDPLLYQAAIQHGQDVPVCLKIGNTYMTSGGTEPAPDLPYADIVMVNPNKGLPTTEVYKIARSSRQAFSQKAQIEIAPQGLLTLVAALTTRRNDLYPAACQLLPEIGTIIEVLERTGQCMLARMSGSGATCFAIYPDRNAARNAAAALMEQHPEWWVVQASLPYLPDPRRRS